MESLDREVLVQKAYGVANACRQSSPATVRKGIAGLLTQLDVCEQPEPGGQDAEDTFDEWGAQVDKQLAELTDQLENCTGVVAEHYSQLSELKEKHDLRLKHLGAGVGSHEKTLGSLRKDLADLTERLDRTLRSLAVKQPLPKPSGEDEDRETDTEIVGIFRRLGQVDTNYRIKFPRVTEQLANLAERVDEEVANLTQKIDDSHNELADRDQILRDRITELTKRVDALVDQMHRDERAFSSHHHATDARAGGSGPPVCDALSPAPAPKPACKHPNTSWAATLISSHSVQVLTCDQPECGAKRLGHAWYTPQPPSEKPDGET